MIVMLGAVILTAVLLNMLLQEPQADGKLSPLGIEPPEPEKADLIVALVPEQNIFSQRKRYRALLDYVGRRAGIKIGVRSLPTYGAVIEALEQRTVHAAFVGSMAYSLARHRAGVIVLARPVWNDGSSTYCSYIFVNASSGIRTVEDMKGKRLALVDRSTMAGYLFPLVYFREHGVEDMGSYFSDVYMTGSHDAAALAVMEKQADVGAAKNHPTERIRSRPEYQQEFFLLVKSAEVPSNGLVVNPTVSTAIRERLKSALLSMEDTAEGRAVLDQFGAREFIATSHSDYANLYDMIRKAGIDLGTFQISNDTGAR